VNSTGDSVVAPHCDDIIRVGSPSPRYKLLAKSETRIQEIFIVCKHGYGQVADKQRFLEHLEELLDGIKCNVLK
jgi:hypothetical protein